MCTQDERNRRSSMTLVMMDMTLVMMGMTLVLNMSTVNLESTEFLYICQQPILSKMHPRSL